MEADTSPVGSPTNIGWLFVKQFYNTRHQQVDQLHRYYNVNESKLTLGLDDETITVEGQKSIHQTMLSITDKEILSIKIDAIDCQQGPAGSIVIQVIGMIVFKGFSETDRRKFCQTFCLDKEVFEGGQVTMSIRNDIFRFLKSEPKEDATPATEAAATKEVAATAPAELEPEVVAPQKSEPAGEETKKVAAKQETPKAPEPVPEAVVEAEAAKAETAPAPAEPVAEATAPATATQESVQAPPAETKAEPPTEAVAPTPAKPEPQAPVQPKVAVSSTPMSWATRAAKPAVEMPQQVKVAAPAPVQPVRVAQTQVKAAPTNAHAHTHTHTLRCPPPLGKGKSLYVKNVPSDCEVQDLVECFKEMGDVRVDSKFGSCINIQNMKSPPKDGRISRYAFVEFATEDALRKTLAPENRKKFFIRTKSGTSANLQIEERKIQDKPRNQGGGRGSGRGRGEGRGRGSRGDTRRGGRR